MEFKDGVSVYTSDNKSAGSLHRVVIDPETKEITHIVIEQGLLVKEDKVIPVEKVASATQDKMTLTCTADEVKEMSPLKIEHYAPLSKTSGREQYIFPLSGGMYMSPSPDLSVITETIRTIPDELVALKDGAPVLTEDGERVGNVERVLTEPETGKVAHFVVSRGLLLKTKKTVPIQWVKKFDDDKVHLAVGSHQLEALPEEQG